MTTPSSRRSGTPSAHKGSVSPRAPLTDSTVTGRALAFGLAAFVKGLAQPRRRADVLQALIDATTATRVPERMAANLVDLASRWFGGDGWAFVAVSEAGGLHWLADRGSLHDRRAAMLEAAGHSTTGAKITWSADAPPAGRPRGHSGALIVAIPVKSHGRPVASLVGLDMGRASRVTDPPDARRLAPLVTLAGHAGGPFDIAVRLKRAAALSSIDDLTGLYNSRFLDGALRREVKRSVRTGRPLSLLFVDLDGFKGINDRYGHLCGSRALVEAAERIQSGARETDVVARFGGDEFALVLPDTGGEGAMLVARRVRERVAGHPFLASEGIGYRLTCSVGAATLPDSASTPESLLAAADSAMYRVKGRGKDGIEMADAAPPSKTS